MKKLFIIYPHWYPSNLAGVHRARLSGNYLSEFGWKPLVLTVKPEFFEESPDPDFYKLFSKEFMEYRVDARKVGKTRLIGDIGLRAFTQLYKKAEEIIRVEKPDFLWIPIPSFYSALLGRLLHWKTDLPYGIDYIDPWVRDISKDGSVRAHLSLWLAKILEPIAVKKACLITGVAEEYYKPVLARNFGNEKKYRVIKVSDKRRETREMRQEARGTVQNTKSSGTLSPSSYNSRHSPHIIFHSAFPYGFDPHDHEIEIPDLNLPWDDRPGCKPIVYAGAFMPNSQVFLDTFFKAFAALDKAGQVDPRVHLYFLGTGMYPHKRVTAYAADHGIELRVTEMRERFPFLHILNFLAKADKVLIIGSTEKHYTASKTFQVILSKRPLMGMFHAESTAVQVLKETNANGYLVTYQPEEKAVEFLAQTTAALQKFFTGAETWNPKYEALEPFSAKASAKALIEAIEKIINI